MIKSGFPSLVPASACGCSMRVNGTKFVSCPKPSATNPVSPGPELGPHLHLQQLLLHQPLQRLLLLRFKVIPIHVNQKFLSHDGVRNRANRNTYQDRVPVQPLPFTTQTLIPRLYAPEIGASSKEAASEFQHLISRRNFAPPGIGCSRLFPSGPRSVRFDGILRTRSAAAS